MALLLVEKLCEKNQVHLGIPVNAWVVQWNFGIYQFAASYEVSSHFLSVLLQKSVVLKNAEEITTERTPLYYFCMLPRVLPIPLQLQNVQNVSN